MSRDRIGMRVTVEGQRFEIATSERLILKVAQQGR
jgi:hypothetical protein